MAIPELKSFNFLNEDFFLGFFITTIKWSYIETCIMICQYRIKFLRIIVEIKTISTRRHTDIKLGNLRELFTAQEKKSAGYETPMIGVTMTDQR